MKVIYKNTDKIFELKFSLKLNKERKYNPAIHVLAGGAAGGVASVNNTLIF